MATSTLIGAIVLALVVIVTIMMIAKSGNAGSEASDGFLSFFGI